MSDPTPNNPLQPFAQLAVAVDLVVLTLKDGELHALLIQRGQPPFEGQWALPGGFVRPGPDGGEDLDAAARRELTEETALDPAEIYLEQLYTFGKRDRDPRGRVLSVAYYALVNPKLLPKIQAGGDAAKADWYPTKATPTLAFDHAEILTTALTRIRGKLDYARLAFDLVAAPFTLAELRAVYEAIEGEARDPSNFRRRVNRWIKEGDLVPTQTHRPTGRRPAQLYQFAKNQPQPNR